jgi:hypothetical protein
MVFGVDTGQANILILFNLANRGGGVSLGPKSLRWSGAAEADGQAQPLPNIVDPK